MRNAFLGTVVFVFCIQIGFGQRGSANGSDRPNIIFIMSDDHAY